MPQSRDEIIEQLHEENGNRWLGCKPLYNCLTCAHAMSADGTNLVCIEDNHNHKHVSDEHVCPKWI